VLVFDHTTLADAAGEINRYNRAKLIIADPAAARLTIDGTFPTNNIAGIHRCGAGNFQITGGKSRRRDNRFALSGQGAALETVTVTSSKIGGDVQNIPISITALSQEQLTATQTAGGPDLVKQVPNLTFTKTNFTGYNIQMRGIGTQAISVTTDPAVAVAFNDIPFIRNHFFEQEFYDVARCRSARAARHALWPQRDGGRGQSGFRQAQRSVRSDGVADIGNYRTAARRHDQHSHRR
jgi:hypothetical protein